MTAHKVWIEVEHLKALVDAGGQVASVFEQDGDDVPAMLHDALFVAEALVEGAQTVEG